MLEAVDAFDDETNPFRLYYFGPFAAVVGATHENGIQLSAGKHRGRLLIPAE